MALPAEPPGASEHDTPLPPQFRIIFLATYRSAARDLEEAATRSTATATASEAHGLLEERDSDFGAGAFSLGTAETYLLADSTELTAWRSGLGAYVLVGDSLAAIDEIPEAERSFAASVEAAGLAKGDELMWVHRVIVGEVPAEACPPLHYGTEVMLSRGASARVARGYSSATNAGPDHIRAIVKGLVHATLLWVITDRISRDATSMLVEAQADPNSLLSERGDRTRALVVESRLLVEIARRMETGLVEAVHATFTAASESWSIRDEIHVVGQRVDAIASVIDSLRIEQRARSDHRRNILLFAIGFTSIAQSVIAGYELAMGDDIASGPRTRVVMSLVTTAPVLLGVIAAMVWVLTNWWSSSRGHD